MTEIDIMQKALNEMRVNLEALQCRLDDVKRSGIITEKAKVKGDDTVVVGSLTISCDLLLAEWKNKPVSLSVKQIRLVHLLAEKPLWVRTREFLMDYLNYPTHAEYRLMDSHIKRIRQAFHKVDPDFSQIEAVWGTGYRWGAPDELEA